MIHIVVYTTCIHGETILEELKRMENGHGHLLSMT